MIENKAENQDIKKIPLELSPELERIYMTGAIGGYTPHDFRLLIFKEITKQQDPDAIDLVRSVSHEIIMSHRAVKELYDWLGKHVETYEEQVKNFKNINEEE